ncbi:MAG TPA: hypothetical protein V6D14_19575 [Coleofasciculaceae cyanobacterium]|jgi:hypothetical protein
MIRDVLSEGHQTEPRIQPKKLGLSTQQAQELIYQFLLELVRKQPPAKVLLEFRHLFFDYESSSANETVIKAISELIFLNNEKEFRQTLKRSCYILVNNWDTTRNHGAIKELVDLFAEFKINKRTLSTALGRLRTWIANFIDSQDYRELKLFIAKYGYSDIEHWSKRYTSYLLVPQYTNPSNPVEQREAARTLSKKLKDQFKFDLAMYTARSQSSVAKHKISNNPTALGDEVLRFIKMIVAKRGSFSYENVANIFLEQTRDVNYKCFKKCLQKYLIFSVANKDFVEALNKRLSEKLECLYESYHEEQLDDAILLRTCNKVIEYLTTEEQHKPSSLFVLLLSQGNPLTLVIVLLKIILICPNARTHLENCIAKLIQYYVDYPEDECRWVISFFEVFNITFAIHADNVQYNLIKMDKPNPDDQSEAGMETYRVFSQLRESSSLEPTEEATPKESTPPNTFEG